MSHVADVKMEIHDLEALAKAAERCGCELVLGQETYHWYGTHVGDYGIPEGFTEEELGKCSHAIRLNAANAETAQKRHGEKPYEVGVVANKNGKGHTLMFDFFCQGMGMEPHAGVDCKKLRQAYTVELERKKAVQLGFKILDEVKLPNGKIVLRVEKKQVLLQR